MALAHYSNIPETATLGEPLYENLFEVTFSFPDTLGLSPDDETLMMISTKNISLDLTKSLGVVQQYFKYSGRNFITTKKDNSTIQDLTLNFNINVDDKNSMRTWNYMKKWYDLAWESATGTLRYKREMIGTITANIYDRKGVVLRRVSFENAQIFGVGGMDFTWDKEDIIDGKASFVSDYWKDLYFDI